MVFRDAEVTPFPLKYNHFRTEDIGFLSFVSRSIKQQFISTFYRKIVGFLGLGVTAAKGEEILPQDSSALNDPPRVH